MYEADWTNETKLKIKRMFKGQNFITPYVIRYGQAGHYYYELSAGTWVHNTKIFGVTVKTIDGGDTELSKMCDSLEEAETYITELEEQ